MKIIDIPLGRKCEVQLDSDKPAMISWPIGKSDIVMASPGEEPLNMDAMLRSARLNGGLVLWGTQHVEDRCDQIILNHLFPGGKQAGAQAAFFSHEILKTTTLRFQDKRTLVERLVQQAGLLKGKKKPRLVEALKKIRDYRNSFAHGHLRANANAGACILTYHACGHQQEDTLSDGYWEALEQVFADAHVLLDEIAGKQTENKDDTSNKTNGE